MKILKCILNIILSFILLCLILALVGLNILNENILKREYVFSIMEDIGFYDQITKEVQSGFEDYIYQSGLPEDTIVNLVSQDTIKNDINSIVNAIYDNTDYTIATEAIRTELDNRIKEYANSQNRVINKTDKDNIDKFENLIVNSYSNNIQITTTGINLIKDNMQKIINIDSKIGNIPVIILVVDLILIIVINRKKLEEILKYIGIPMFSAGVLFKLLYNVINGSIDIDNVELFATSLTSFVQNIYRDILYKIDNIGLYMIVGGITLIIIYSILYSNRKSKNVDVLDKKDKKDKENKEDKTKKQKDSKKDSIQNKDVTVQDKKASEDEKNLNEFLTNEKEKSNKESDKKTSKKVNDKKGKRSK